MRNASETSKSLAPHRPRLAARVLGAASLLAGMILPGVLLPTTAIAQSHTPLYWDSTSGTNVLWSTAADWWTTPTGTVSTLVPVLATNDAVFDGSGVNGTTIVQLNAAAGAYGLYFNNTGSTLLDSSSATSETLSIGTDGITVASGAGQVTLGDLTDLMPISVTGSQSWTNNSTTNALNVVNGIAIGANTLTLAGPGSMNFGGAISGTGGAVTQSGSGTLTLSAASTYTGVTTVSGGGTLVIGGAGSVTGTPVLTVNNGTLVANSTSAPATILNIYGTTTVPSSIGAAAVAGNSTGTLYMGPNLGIGNTIEDTSGSKNFVIGNAINEVANSASNGYVYQEPALCRTAARRICSSAISDLLTTVALRSRMAFC